MAILIEGSEFLTNNGQKGFAEYVNQEGRIQNKNVDYNTSVKKVSWIDGTEGNDWIAAPFKSTHKWVLKANAGDDFIQGRGLIKTATGSLAMRAMITSTVQRISRITSMAAQATTACLAMGVTTS